jgi:predicted ATPase
LGKLAVKNGGGNMAIKRFQFEDRLHRWKLNEVEFSSVNLLVGASGAGKTRILEALMRVCYSLYNATYADNCRWSLELEFENLRFSWEAEIALPQKHLAAKQDTQVPTFLRERVILDSETIIVDRSEKEFIFNGAHLPKLKNTESAIALLSDETSLAPINRALRRVIFSEGTTEAYAIGDSHDLSLLRQYHRTLDRLREANEEALTKAYILQEDFPDKFQRIKEDYMEIFDTVYDVKIRRLHELDPSAKDDMLSDEMDSLAIGVREHGVEGWIASPRLSSGMSRTFIHLIELALAPPGTVILIDDFENSLGVNCLPQLTELILKYSTKHQFILTSHHPYVINNIPSHWWKIVTRKGSMVTVLDADSIPALKTASAHEKFFQLMNLKEYEEGIQRSIPLINLNT